MMEINEEFLNKPEIKIKTDLLKWLSSVFDTYEGDFYFPWNSIDDWIKIYDETNNSEYIKSRVRKIQNELIDNGGDVFSLFEKEFKVKII
jgi:hypothetical protein